MKPNLFSRPWRSSSPCSPGIILLYFSFIFLLGACGEGSGAGILPPNPPPDWFEINGTNYTEYEVNIYDPSIDAAYVDATPITTLDLESNWILGVYEFWFRIDPRSTGTGTFPVVASPVAGESGSTYQDVSSLQFCVTPSGGSITVTNHPHIVSTNSKVSGTYSNITFSDAGCGTLDLSGSFSMRINSGS